MCCRYEVNPGSEKAEAIVTMLEKLYPDTAYKTGEIFPGDTAPGVIDRGGRILPVPATFGFPGRRGSELILNARSETAAEKPMFADSLRERRIVLPADGFFEWSHTREKTKYFFTVEALRTIYLCGVYKIVDGRVRFVILTCPANESMLETHDRMPVIVSDGLVRPYLTDREAAMEIIATSAPLLKRREAAI